MLRENRHPARPLAQCAAQIRDENLKNFYTLEQATPLIAGQRATAATRTH
jgi:hypothetical protein